MKKLYTIAIAAFLVFSLAVSASAAPRLQTYITGSRYEFWGNGLDQFSCVTNSQQFNLSIVGSWGPDADIISGGGGANMLEGVNSTLPTYDYLDTYLSISVPKNQSGSVFINGQQITVFEKHFDAVPEGRHSARYHPWTNSKTSSFNFQDVGRMTNEGVADWHYGYNGLTARVQGFEMNFDVVVEGFDWVNFGAVGVNSKGQRRFTRRTNMSHYDSNYFTTPEPGTLSLLGLGLLGIAPFIKRKK